MRRTLLALVSASLLAIGMVAPATAISGDYRVDNEHPFVGLVAFYADRQGSDAAFLHRCSGTLLNDGTPEDGSKVFLTAGHCTDDGTGDAVAVSARVWFRQDAGTRYDGTRDPLSGYPDKCIDDKSVALDACVTSHEMYNYGFDNFAGFPDHRDVGIVILDKPVVLPSYGELSPLNTIDSLGNKGSATFTVSGYGITSNTNTAAPALSFRERLQAEATLVTTKSTWTDGYNFATQGSGDDRGGTCSGDSGGPVFYPGSADGFENEVVGVTSFGRTNPNDCVGLDWAYRVDRADVLAWMDSVIGTNWSY